MRQATPEDLQREHGAGMTKPDAAREASLLRRREEGSAGLGMILMSKKRKHDNVEEGDQQHPLYPQDQSGSSYHRFRDETTVGGDQVSRPLLAYVAAEGDGGCR